MKRILPILFVLAFAAAATATAAQALADVAKKTEEERAKAAAAKKEPPKVITNGDLRKDPNAAATAETGEAPEKPKAADEKRAEKKDQTEAYWKKRATELHERLATDEKTASIEREKLDRLRRNLDALGCIGCRQRNQLESQLVRQQDEQSRLDAKVKADKDAIQAFEEEGRKAGVLPGWLRPE